MKMEKSQITNYKSQQRSPNFDPAPCGAAKLMSAKYALTVLIFILILFRLYLRALYWLNRSEG